MTTDQIKEAAIEAAAIEIYKSWQDQPGWILWVLRGNSDKQNLARTIARAAIDAYEKAMWSKNMRGAPDDEVILVESRDEYGEWSVDPALKLDAGEWETMGGTILNKPRRFRPLPQPPEGS